MIFNKEDIILLAASKTVSFDKEGPLFIQEKSEGFFKRTESKYKVELFSSKFLQNVNLIK